MEGLISKFFILASMALVVLLTSSDTGTTMSNSDSTSSSLRPPAPTPESNIATSSPESNIATSSEWAASLLRAPLGSMGPGTKARANLRYYDSLYYLAHQYGADASSLLEVGCANDPFANKLDWIEERACVAPYFINYEGHKEGETKSSVSNAVQSFKADFMKWKEPHRYDLVLCGQVLEHVPDPRGFLQKLIATAKQATVVSVPYKWPACGTQCGHLHHLIDEKTIEEWAAPHKPVYHAVVREKKGDARIVAIFAPVVEEEIVETSFDDLESEETPDDI